MQYIQVCRGGYSSMRVSVYKLSVKHESFAFLLDLCKVELNICSICKPRRHFYIVHVFIHSLKYICTACLKFIKSEKATKSFKISTLDLTGTTQDKSTVEVSQNFVAFSEYMNFTMSVEKVFQYNVLINHRCTMIMRVGK